MNSFDYGVALLFGLLVLTLGMMFSRSGKNMNSFFAAGGAVPWWVSGLSLFMSFFSVGTFVVWGSIAYADGLVSVVIQVTMAVSGLVIALGIAPAWNRTRALTAAEFISLRLGESVQRKFSALFLLINLFTAGAFLYPVGKIIEVTTGLPLEVAILGLGAFIIAYTAVGGLWAVLVTDVLQFTVLTAAVVIVVPLSLDSVGGISGLVERVPEGFMALHNDVYTPVFLVAFTIYNIVFIGGNWAYVQRYTSVATPRDARKVGWLFGGLYLLAPIVWMIPPMAYRVLDPSLAGTEAEDAYLLMSQEVVPAGLLGLILGAMIFATASSVNTTLNISAGVWTHDIYRHLKERVSERETMIMARASTLVFGGLAITVAMLVQSMGGIVSVVLTVAALTGAAIYLPPIWAIFSRRQTGRSILSTTVGSLIINLFLKFGWPLLGGAELTRAAEMLVGVLVPILFLSGFELFYFFRQTKNPQYERYLAHRRQQRTETETETRSSSKANHYAVRILMIGMALIGLLIALLGVVAESASFETLLVGLLIFIPAMYCLKPLKWFAVK